MNHVVFLENEMQQGFLPLQDHRSQHILSILKKTPGQSFVAGVVNHSRGFAILSSYDQQNLFFDYQAQLPSDTLLPITLLIGTTRPPVMRRIIRDATAFGVEKITLVHCDNSEKSYLESHLWSNENYMQSVYEGLSLSKCVKTPSIARFFHLQQALDMLPTQGQRVLAHADAPHTLSQVAQPGAITVAIGPERGFCKAELDLFGQYHFISGHMGSHIVRTETAVMLALGMVSCACQCL
jgi:16S rRNA (uracil1498-N3)-methyltransferase